MRYPSRTVGDSTLVASRVVSTAPIHLVDIVGWTNGTARYLIVFELAAVPLNGTSGRFTIDTGGGSGNFALALPDAIDLDACVVAASSTPDTLTAVAGNNQSIQGLIGS